MQEVKPEQSQGRYINLEAQDRFVATSLLRAAYLQYEGSQNPTAQNFVNLSDNLELGIVSSGVIEVARAVSSLLSRSLEMAKDEHDGGHLPAEVVKRVQREIISPYGVANVWGTTGHRFVLSQRVSASQSEVLATILVSRSKDTIFFLTGRYNNLRHSTIAQDVDFEQPAKDNPAQKWFDLFVFPRLDRFKPLAYHHIANFVVAPEHRNRGLARLLISSIVKKYARDHIVGCGGEIEHSQHLLCGRGFWQIGDPPWLPRMRRLGFYLRWGAESFFMERDWAPLPRVFDQGEPISNLEYNRRAGLPQLYDEKNAPVGGEHLLERVPEVVALAQSPHAKLQYFQTMFDFIPSAALQP